MIENIFLILIHTVYREHVKKRKHIPKTGHMAMKKKLKVYGLLAYKKSSIPHVIYITTLLNRWTEKVCNLQFKSNNKYIIIFVGDNLKIFLF